MGRKEKEFYNKIEELHQTAQKMNDEYEKAIVLGNDDVKCPYEDIIDIYDQIREMIVNTDIWGFDSDNNYQILDAHYFWIQISYEKKLEALKKSMIAS